MGKFEPEALLDLVDLVEVAIERRLPRDGAVYLVYVSHGLDRVRRVTALIGDKEREELSWDHPVFRQAQAILDRMPVDDIISRYQEIEKQVEQLERWVLEGDW